MITAGAPERPPLWVRPKPLLRFTDAGMMLAAQRWIKHPLRDALAGMIALTAKASAEGWGPSHHWSSLEIYEAFTRVVQWDEQVCPWDYVFLPLSWLPYFDRVLSRSLDNATWRFVPGTDIELARLMLSMCSRPGFTLAEARQHLGPPLLVLQ